jgi:hypothetical protein
MAVCRTGRSELERVQCWREAAIGCCGGGASAGRARPYLVTTVTLFDTTQTFRRRHGIWWAIRYAPGWSAASAITRIGMRCGTVELDAAVERSVGRERARSYGFGGPANWFEAIRAQRGE